MDRLEGQLLEAVSRFHDDQPMRPGMQRASLLARLPENVPAPIAEFALQRLVISERVETQSDVVWLSTHQVRLDPEGERVASLIIEEARRVGLEPPGSREWAELLGVSGEKFRDLVAHLERQGHLIRAPGDLWFDRESVERLREKVIRHLEEHGELDTQSYKALIGTSRRTAMPLMELLDELHTTRRRGEVRILRPGASR